MFFKLGIRAVHDKKSKMTPVRPLHDNSYTAGPLLIKTKIPRLYPKDHPLTTIEWGEVRQYGNHVCAELDPLFHSKRLQMGIFGISQKETRAESVAMALT